MPPGPSRRASKAGWRVTYVELKRTLLVSLYLLTKGSYGQLMVPGVVYTWDFFVSCQCRTCLMTPALLTLHHAALLVHQIVTLCEVQPCSCTPCYTRDNLPSGHLAATAFQQLASCS